MKKEEVVFLAQLVKTLEEAGIEMESAYENGDSERFNKIKVFIIRINSKISEIINE
jgi:hypothetical protein